MAKKLPVIIDNTNGDTVLQALCKLLPGVQRMNRATNVCAEARSCPKRAGISHSFGQKFRARSGVAR